MNDSKRLRFVFLIRSSIIGQTYQSTDAPVVSSQLHQKPKMIRITNGIRCSIFRSSVSFVRRLLKSMSHFSVTYPHARIHQYWRWHHPPAISTADAVRRNMRHKTSTIGTAVSSQTIHRVQRASAYL